MPRPSFAAVCDALATVVETVPGLRAKDHPSDDIAPDEAQIFNREFDPRMVFDSPKATVPFTIMVAVQRTNLRTAHKKLRAYIDAEDPASVMAAVENEDLWPVTVDYAVVTLIGQPFELVQVDTAYLAVNIDVDVCW